MIEATIGQLSLMGQASESGHCTIACFCFVLLWEGQPLRIRLDNLEGNRISLCIKKILVYHDLVCT